MNGRNPSSTPPDSTPRSYVLTVFRRLLGDARTDYQDALSEYHHSATMYRWAHNPEDNKEISYWLAQCKETKHILRRLCTNFLYFIRFNRLKRTT